MTIQHLLLKLTQLLLLAAILLMPGTVPSTHAQGPDEENDIYGTITNVRIISVLPAGVRFWTRVEAPHDDVESVTVTISQNDAVIVQDDLPLDDVILFGNEFSIEYEFFLDVSQYEELEFFQPLVYRMDSVTANGVESAFEGVTTIEHQDIGRWQTADLSRRITLHWPDPSMNGQGIVEDLIPVFSLLSQSIEGDPAPVTVALYAPFEPYCDIVIDDNGDEVSLVLSERANYLCSREAVIELYEERDILYLELPEVNYQFVLEQLAILAVRYNYELLWGDAEVPAWFREGLAIYYAPRFSADALRRAQRASQTNQLLRLGQMNELPQENIDAELWNAQAETLMLYIADQNGADAPQRIAALIDEDTAFTEAFLEVMDVDDLQTFYARWQLWLDTARALRVAEWNPYQPVTPTPTLTPTASPTRPTNTPFPTSTITLTPTDRPLFVPTNPPTFTIAPPTRAPSPTVTALPAGFFDDQEPLVQPAPAQDSGDDSVCGSGLGALFLPLTALLFSWRRKHV